MTKEPVTLIKEETHPRVEKEPKEEEEESYDEDEDEDYDPSAAKNADKKKGEDDDDDSDDEDANGKIEEDEPIPDFSAIESGGESFVKTRRQRQEEDVNNPYKSVPEGLVRGNKYSNIDVNEIFNLLKEESAKGHVVAAKPLETVEHAVSKGGPTASATATELSPNTKGTTSQPGEPEMITIESSYTFAGKVITETKQVEIGSAEAKAYLNSTGNIAYTGDRAPKKEQRSFVPVIREVNGEHLELRIKLKRPSLIDKFLLIQGNKLQKLSTLEKSRLDWASFVDKRKLQDDLKLHNKDGYLDKQDFLNRVELKKGEQYKLAQEEDRKNRMNEEKNQ